MRCPLCREASAHSPSNTYLGLDVICQHCRAFRITDTAETILKEDPETSFYLGSWVFEQNQLGNTPNIDSSILAFFKTYNHPNVQKRAELYLGRAIELLSGRLTGRVEINHPALRVASWSLYPEDLIGLANYWVELGAISRERGTDNYQIVAKAHVLYEQIANARGVSSQAFVAMWFDPQMRDAYDRGFEKAIRAAGYAPLRIDRKEHDGKIDDQIIAEIRRSAFVVADFTGHRGGVYYEAGFAHGLGRRVIFTCRSDELDKLHFRCKAIRYH